MHLTPISPARGGQAVVCWSLSVIGNPLLFRLCEAFAKAISCFTTKKQIATSPAAPRNDGKELLHTPSALYSIFPPHPNPLPPREREIGSLLCKRPVAFSSLRAKRGSLGCMPLHNDFFFSVITRALARGDLEIATPLRSSQ